MGHCVTVIHNLKERMRERNATICALAIASGCGLQTIRRASRGIPVRVNHARWIIEALENRVFHLKGRYQL